MDDLTVRVNPRLTIGFRISAAPLSGAARPWPRHRMSYSRGRDSFWALRADRRFRLTCDRSPPVDVPEASRDSASANTSVGCGIGGCGEALYRASAPALRVARERRPIAKSAPAVRWHLSETPAPRSWKACSCRCAVAAAPGCGDDRSGAPDFRRRLQHKGILRREDTIRCRLRKPATRSRNSCVARGIATS